ncbi:transketolase [Sporolactobacillus vineae]|uniref:transketolase n=1 Tax=Sporolactobacillus vineae TaxID=444463 RepID=UPI0002882BF5|nr:transketolase [Sporolactobacillus vineae]
MRKSVDQLAVDTLRMLSLDMISQANSGHPGLPLGAAPMAYTLWSRCMTFNPDNPHWFNRDRFVLSAGHGSALLYSLLHVFGYSLTVDDLKAFRKLGSRTPGHPEYGLTPGVEAMTGPLGQGFAMATGMAITEAHLAGQFNRPAFPVVNHFIYVLCGDGDLMEGITSEAASLAGHLKLGKLIVLYDSNRITLDGGSDRSFTENVQDRFRAYGWQTLTVEDGNRLDDIDEALRKAKADSRHPSLIEVHTVIGYGAPDIQGKHTAHGAPLSAEEMTLTKKGYGWTHEPFFVPDPVYRRCAESGARGRAEEAAWTELLKDFAAVYPDENRALNEAIEGKIPDGYDAALPDYKVGTQAATRKLSGDILQNLGRSIPFLFGGSADLFSSVQTYLKGEGDFQPDSYAGRNIWFGVREFAMAGIVNGMTLHGGVKAYGSTFFAFSDYLKPALRVAALMKIPSIFIFTHDSIAVGEDGPTHQPVEQLAGLRAMPGLQVIRPADAAETREAWKLAVESTHRPTVLVLTRQSTTTYEGEVFGAPKGVRRGGYIVSAADPAKPEAGILIATGSEVGLAIETQKRLAAEHTNVRVVSLPSFDLFDAQGQAYRNHVLPPELTVRVGIEMAASFGWDRYVGPDGGMVAVDRFGASGKGTDVTAAYGFTPEHVADVFMHFLKAAK